MNLLVADLKLPADKLAQFAAALGDAGEENAAVQDFCNGAAADVTRLTAGFVLDATSLTNFGRAIALFRIYAQVGPVPDDVAKAYDDAWKELQSIAKGDRPNLPTTPVNGLTSSAGNWGSAAKVI